MPREPAKLMTAQAIREEVLNPLVAFVADLMRDISRFEEAVKEKKIANDFFPMAMTGAIDAIADLRHFHRAEFLTRLDAALDNRYQWRDLPGQREKRAKKPKNKR